MFFDINATIPGSKQVETAFSNLKLLLLSQFYPYHHDLAGQECPTCLSTPVKISANYLERFGNESNFTKCPKIAFKVLTIVVKWMILETLNGCQSHNFQ